MSAVVVCYFMFRLGTCSKAKASIQTLFYENTLRHKARLSLNKGDNFMCSVITAVLIDTSRHLVQKKKIQSVIKIKW